ncbi:MAG: hypothetical protein PHH70_03255 [Candidatus Gracilibacteria bacterium]|nr:hypothetical protein [Candidatus Gracilibacteria bacterium]
MKNFLILSLSLVLLASCGKSEPFVSGGAPSTSISVIQSGATRSPVIDEAQTKKNQETYQSALKSLDASKCQDISDEFGRTMCTDSVLPLQAKRDKNESLCDTFADPMNRNSCATPIILEKARLATDSKICAKLGDDMSRKSCVALISQMAAEKSLDPSKCGTIADDMNKRSCEQSIALKRATEKGDKGACASLDPMMKSGCELQATIAQNAKSGKTDSCNALDSMMKSGCIFQSLVERAVVEKDLGACESDKEIAISCKSEAARKLLAASQDPQYCEYMGNKEKCLTDLAVRKSIGRSDKKLCEELANVSSQRNCHTLYDAFEQLMK